MTRFRLIGAAILSLLLLAVGGLFFGALSSQARVAGLQRQQRADVVFDGIERELALLVGVEEQRPFLHWSYHFVPTNDLNSSGLSRSPLASLPVAPIIGYFQLLPDGGLETPYAPRSGSTTNPFQQVQDVRGRLEVVVAPLRSSPAVAALRSRPPAQVQKAQFNQVENFAGNASPVELFEQQAVQFNQQQRQEKKTKAAPVPVPSLPSVDSGRGVDGEIGVAVGAFELMEAEEALVLYRQVSVAGDTWIQGLALERESFLMSLSHVETGELNWSGDAHRFAPPFDALSATLVEESGPQGASVFLWALALITLVVLGAGAVLADRWMTATLFLAKQRTDFVAAVSHELRTPLTSIRMYADMLEQGMVSPEQQKTYHRTIRTESERLGRLVEDVLAFSRLERVGEGGPPGTLGEAAAEMCRMLEPVAEATGATLRVDLGGADEVQVADRDALVQVLTNLVDNALKFSAQSEVKEVEVQARRVGDAVEIRVSDRGPGVAPSFVGKMFEPFVRGEREATRRTRGTGIGLALVAGLVERLGGAVEAANRASGGLEVVVRLEAPPSAC